MGVLFDLVGMPGLTMVAFVVLGGTVIAVPRRVVGALGDAFGFAVDFDHHGGVKVVTARAVGVGLIGFGLFLGINTLVLARAFAHI